MAAVDDDDVITKTYLQSFDGVLHRFSTKVNQVTGNVPILKDIFKALPVKPSQITATLIFLGTILILARFILPAIVSAVGFLYPLVVWARDPVRLQTAGFHYFLVYSSFAFLEATLGWLFWGWIWGIDAVYSIAKLIVLGWTFSHLLASATSPDAAAAEKSGAFLYQSAIMPMATFLTHRLEILAGHRIPAAPAPAPAPAGEGTGAGAAETKQE